MTPAALRIALIRKHLPAARVAMAEAYPHAPSHHREPLARSFAELHAGQDMQRGACLDGLVLTAAEADDLRALNSISEGRVG